MTIPTSGRLGGIDYGTVRLGLALCDPGQQFASPYENYTRRSEPRDSERLQQFTREEELVGFVVGLPLHISGDESEKSLEARRFATWLVEVVDRPVVLWDERYTSADAEQYLIEASMTKKRRKQRLDMVAAQIILSSYLGSTRNSS